MKKPMKKLFVVAGAAVALMVGLTGCGSHFTDPSMVSLRYANGVNEGGEFKECVLPGTKTVSDDTFYNYPTTQREDIWSSDKYNPEDGANSPADQGDLEVTAKGGNLGYLEVKVAFSLVTDCDTLREFHEKIGRTRGAYFNEDGSYNSGWLWVMSNYITSATEDLARTYSSAYTIEELWLQPEKRQELAAKIKKEIQEAVNERTEGETEFFVISSVRVDNASPTAEFQKLYDDRKNAQVRAETAEANKLAQVQEAQAQTEVALEQAKARAAEIQGWGGADAYLKKLAIDSGMNPYQPSYGQSPTVTTPTE